MERELELLTDYKKLLDGLLRVNPNIDLKNVKDRFDLDTKRQDLIQFLKQKGCFDNGARES